MSSNTSGYVALALVGGLMVSLIFAGAYYSSGSNIGTPTGMGVYDTNYRQFGGRKTHKRNKNKNRKTKRL